MHQKPMGSVDADCPRRLHVTNLLTVNAYCLHAQTVGLYLLVALHACLPIELIAEAQPVLPAAPVRYSPCFLNASLCPIQTARDCG